MEKFTSTKRFENVISFKQNIEFNKAKKHWAYKDKDGNPNKIS